ncbi:MAG: TIGR02391 family protein [Verrucomicrobiia bacterium]
MRDDIPHYSATYLSKDVHPDQIEAFVREVRRKFERLKLRSVEVDYNKLFSIGVCDGKLSHYRKAYAKRARDIRKYRLHFCDLYATRLYSPPHVEVTVRVRDTWDNPSYPKITIDGYGCNREDFAEFLSTAVNSLGLEKYPGRASEFDDSVIEQDYERIVGNPAVRNQIMASVAGHNYDAALRTASSILEDKLRQRCIAAGRLEAAKQTGVDLAVTAFHKDRGCLKPPWPVSAEPETGAQLMFQGFFMYLRNAFMHNTVVMGEDRTAVFECLMTCGFLMSVVEASTIR